MNKKKLNLTGLEHQFNKMHGITPSEFLINEDLTSTTEGSSTTTTTTTYLPGSTWTKYDPNSDSWVTGQTLDTVTVTGTIRGQGEIFIPGTPFNLATQIGGTINSVVAGAPYVPSYQDYIRVNLSGGHSMFAAVIAYGQYNNNYNGLTTLVTGYDASGNNIGAGVKVVNPFISGGAFLNYITGTQT